MVMLQYKSKTIIGHFFSLIFLLRVFFGRFQQRRFDIGRYVGRELISFPPLALQLYVRVGRGCGGTYLASPTVLTHISRYRPFHSPFNNETYLAMRPSTCNNSAQPAGQREYSLRFTLDILIYGQV